MVLPTMSKSLNDIPEIGVMWKSAHEAITKAESLMLFGFSMPTSDELLTQMIRASIRAGRRLRRVASIDLDPGGVLDRFERCVPDDMEIETATFPVVAGEIPRWFETARASRSEQSSR
jgi:hypothetical protein